MIDVTKPFMPPIEEYQEMLKGIYERGWLTNNGPLVNELELKIKEHLGVKNMLYVSNGTIALQIAIKALDLSGEIITTPFSYVATTSSIVWENCIPVFADISPTTFNIDPLIIESVITEKTTAILATHVYGNPCDIEAIETIAKKHNLKVIYDAAHCFGTKYKGKSIFEYGDISTVSFHATKLFHTIEGGAIFTNSTALHKKMAYIRNFGHDGPAKFKTLGINGKNSEFHAAMGLVNIKHIDSIYKSRKTQSDYYDKKLKSLKFIKPEISIHASFNYAYYPIIVESESQLNEILEELNNNKVYPRRYFFPCLNKLTYVEAVEMPIAEAISKRVLCLPLFHTLSFEEISFVCRIILRVQKKLKK